MFEKIKSILKKNKGPAKVKKRLDQAHHVIKNHIRDGKISIESRLKDVMSEEIKFVSPADNLRKALEIIAQHSISSLPVIDKKSVVGTVDEETILNFMRKHKILDTNKDEISLTELESTLVKEVMNKNIVTADKNMLLTDATYLIEQKNADMIIVVDDKNEPVGVAVRENIIKGLVTEYFVKSIKKGTESTIETGIDRMLGEIEKNKIISIKDLSRILGEDLTLIERWAKYFENKGLVRIDYPPIGSPKVRLIK